MFKSAKLKVTGTITGNEDDWLDYSEGANAKITLPAAGVWQITLNTDYKKISLAQIEGDEIVVKEFVDVVTNPEVFVVKAGMKAETGNAWDNQFFITANAHPLFHTQRSNIVKVTKKVEIFCIFQKFVVNLQQKYV